MTTRRWPRRWGDGRRAHRVDEVGRADRHRERWSRREVPSRVQAPDRVRQLLLGETVHPRFRRSWGCEPRVEERHLQRRIASRERGHQVPDVGPDAARHREEQLVDVCGHPHRDASTHEQPFGPTIAACSVPGSMSRRSPGLSSTSPPSRWNVIEPSRQNSTLWKPWACGPYSSPGPLPHDLGAEHPSARKASSAASRPRPRTRSSTRSSTPRRRVPPAAGRPGGRTARRRNAARGIRVVPSLQRAEPRRVDPAGEDPRVGMWALLCEVALERSDDRTLLVG